MSSFTARPPDLRRLSFDHRGLSVISPLATLGVASDPVLVNRPAVSLPASFPRSVTLPQLRLASFGMVSFREDFHLQDDVHARRTKEKARCRFRSAGLVKLAGLRSDYMLRQEAKSMSMRTSGAFPITALMLSPLTSVPNRNSRPTSRPCIAR